MPIPVQLPIPEQVWLPLGLAALAPLVLLAVIAPLLRRRARGIATALTLQTIVVLSLGFAVLAAVATISVARTGLRELGERHSPGIRTLARELEQMPLGLGGVNAPIALALFRAKYPSVAFVVVGTARCRVECVISSADESPAGGPTKTRLSKLWPRDLAGQTLTSMSGQSVLVVAEPLRDAAAANDAAVVVGIRADPVANQATMTAWILLSIGYALLLVVGWTSWRQLDTSLGSRIAAITRQVRAGSAGEEGVALEIDGRELSELAEAVTTYIHTTVEEQRSSDERYRRLVELAPDAIIMCSTTGIKFANSAALALAGVKDRYDVIGRPIEKFLKFESMRAREAPETLRPAKWTRVDGAVLHVEVAEITDRAVRDGSHQYMVRDVTERRAREAALAHRAEHDSLTGLVNRARFENRLVDLLESHARTRLTDLSREVAVLFIDLDGFKPVNDKYGHAAGDAVLVGVAARLRESTRGTDVIARLGGDEFAVLVDVRDHDEVNAVAERILDALTRPILFDGNQLVVGASIGIADSSSIDSGDSVPTYADAAVAAAELLRAADAAMYVAKGNGGRRYGVTPSIQSPEETTPVSFRVVA